jgi:hypothetical protein
MAISPSTWGKTWVEIQVSGGGGYHFTSVTETELTQDVVANALDLSNGLKNNGHIVLNGILFDTGKDVVKPESSAALDEVVKMLKEDAKVKVYVVGHTDNVGALAGNIDLEETGGCGGAGADNQIRDPCRQTPILRRGTLRADRVKRFGGRAHTQSPGRAREAVIARYATLALNLGLLF